MAGFRSSCGACRFLRRKCNEGCVFAPYFCYEQGAAHFAAVHKVFGASNVSKLLSHLPPHNRRDAAITISYEALARMQDPIYGCVARIFELQLQVATLQEEIELLETQVSQSGTVANNVQFHSTSQTMLNNTSTTTEVQFSLQPDCMNTIYEQGYNGQAAFGPSLPMDAVANLVTHDDIINMGLQLSPPCIRGDSTSLFMDSENHELKTSEINFSSVMEFQEVFPCEFWLDDTSFVHQYSPSIPNNLV